MPLAPRPAGRAKKIAYALLGTPPNLRKGGKRRKPKAYNPNELYLGTMNRYSDFIT